MPNPEQSQQLRDTGPDSLKMHAIQTPDGGVRFVHDSQNEVERVFTPAPMAQRAVDKRQLELDAGAARVALNEEIKRNRPMPKKSPAELQSEGRSNPVFRPNIVRADKSRVKGQDRGLDPYFNKIGSNVKTPEPEAPPKIELPEGAFKDPPKGE